MPDEHESSQLLTCQCKKLFLIVIRLSPLPIDVGVRSTHTAVAHVLCSLKCALWQNEQNRKTACAHTMALPCTADMFYYNKLPVSPSASTHAWSRSLCGWQGSHLKAPGAVKALRCQLPRSNPYYSPEPPRASQKLPPSLQVSMIQVCSADLLLIKSCSL